MAIYVIKCLSNTEEYVSLAGGIADIKIPVLKSEIHKLTEDKVIFDIMDDGGVEIPDLFCYEGIYLVSNRIKELLDLNNTSYLFWKEADIHSEKYGIHEEFWIIVPPRIDCIDVDKSDIKTDNWDFNDGLVPMFEYNKLRIIPKLLGRFDVFKILGILDNNIYITDKIYEQMISQKYTGIDFIKIQ